MSAARVNRGEPLTRHDDQRDAEFVAALRLVRNELGGVVISDVAVLVDEVDLATWDGGDAA